MIEQLFENAPCGYFGFNDHATTIVANDTLASILERPKEDIIGKSVEIFFTLPTRIFFQTHFFPMIQMQGHAEEIFITLLTAKGTHLPVLLNAKKIKWGEQLITCCSCILVPNRKKFEDELITARKTAEKALQENTELIKAKFQLQQQTEQLDRQIQIVQKQNHELQQFNHAVTHNLKEPLRKILMYTDMLSRETTTTLALKLAKASEQMKAVVSGLQQYVWLKEKITNYTQVDLNSLVEGVASQIKAEFQNVETIIQHNKLPSIEGDKDQLALMMRHILSNALKFRKGEQASVSIEGTLVKQNLFRSVENKYQYQDYVRIEILDQGIGFDPVYVNQIFELFRKVHHLTGQGLGLALCKKIVENHRGHIKAESELNSFTKITVWLPCSQPSAGSNEPISAEFA